MAYRWKPNERERVIFAAVRQIQRNGGTAYVAMTRAVADAGIDRTRLTSFQIGRLAQEIEIAADLARHDPMLRRLAG